MSLQDRWYSHVYKRDKCLYDIIHTYGIDKFNIVKIDAADNAIDASQKEEYWIQFFMQRYELINTRIGQKLTDAEKQHLHDINIGRHGYWRGKKLSDAHKSKISHSKLGKYTGNDNGFYGHTHTDKVKKIISIANKNKALSDAHKNKISNGLRGKYTGCDSQRSREIICCETGETFVSIRAAQHEYNVTTITKCLNGKCKTAGNLNGMKLHWVYKS